jgi:hypothetical protein
VRGHIRTRRGPMGTTSQLAVYIGVDERGCQRYGYETVRGSRRDAERRLAELVTAAGIGDLGTKGVVRFGELVDAWWEVSTTDLSPNTRIGYRGSWTATCCRRSDTADSTGSGPQTWNGCTRSCSRARHPDSNARRRRLPPTRSTVSSEG